MLDFIFICWKAKRGIRSLHLAMIFTLKFSKNIEAVQKISLSSRTPKAVNPQPLQQNVSKNSLNGALLKSSNMEAFFINAIFIH